MPETTSDYILQLDLLGGKYSQSIPSCLSADDFLEQIKLTVDLPSNVLAPGELPGGKTFKGYVNGNRFSIRKKGFRAGKHTRELQGRVSSVSQGNKTQTFVEIRFSEDPWMMIARFLTIVGVSACGASVVLSLFFLLKVGEIFNTPQGLFFTAIVPVVFFFLFYYAFKCSTYFGYSGEEEVLDHVKKIAAGVVPNPDSVI